MPFISYFPKPPPEAERAASDWEFHRPDWSLGNVLSWIVFRDPAQIRRYAGYFIPSRDTDWTIFCTQFGARFGAASDQGLPDPRPAAELLLAALKVGKLTAIQGGEVLPTEQWFGLEIRDLRPALRFRSAKAVRLWPAKTAKPAAMPRPTMALPELQNWYAKVYISECKAAGEQPSEERDWIAAKAIFGSKVRRSQIRTVRKQKAPADWRRQGRRPNLHKNSAENSAE
jgi:hypothetical protein